MQCKECLEVLGTIGEAFNSGVSTEGFLERTAQAMVEQLHLKACHFLLLSRDQKLLEHAASYGLSEKFLARGPVEAEKSVVEALRGKTVTISECANDAQLQYPADHAEEGLVSALIAPLKTRDQVIGVMRLYTGEKRNFSVLELKVTEVLTSLCTRAIIHSMFHRIQGELRTTIRSSLDLDSVLESIARVISEQLRAKGCSIHLVEDDGLRIRASFGLSRGFLEVLTASTPKGIRMALEGSCSQLYDPRKRPRSPFLDEVLQEGISSILYVPLMARDKAIGALCLHTHHPYRFSADETFFMQGIADQCTLTVQHARMHSTVKHSYESLMNDFQLWFGTGPPSGVTAAEIDTAPPRPREAFRRARPRSEP